MKSTGLSDKYILVYMISTYLNDKYVQCTFYLAKIANMRNTHSVYADSTIARAQAYS